MRMWWVGMDSGQAGLGNLIIIFYRWANVWKIGLNGPRGLIVKNKKGHTRDITILRLVFKNELPANKKPFKTTPHRCACMWKFVSAISDKGLRRTATALRGCTPFFDSPFLPPGLVMSSISFIIYINQSFFLSIPLFNNPPGLLYILSSLFIFSAKGERAIEGVRGIPVQRHRAIQTTTRLATTRVRKTYAFTSLQQSDLHSAGRETKTDDSRTYIIILYIGTCVDQTGPAGVRLSCAYPADSQWVPKKTIIHTYYFIHVKALCVPYLRTYIYIILYVQVRINRTSPADSTHAHHTRPEKITIVRRPRRCGIITIILCVSS